MDETEFEQRLLKVVDSKVWPQIVEDLAYCYRHIAAASYAQGFSEGMADGLVYGAEVPIKKRSAMKKCMECWFWKRGWDNKGHCRVHEDLVGATGYCNKWTKEP